MSKHTPGPWEINPNSSIEIISKSTCLVATLNVTAETDANLKLIAAAPDTLEALTGKEEDPHLWAVNWLATLLRVCRKQEVYKAIVEDQGGDADSVGTMLMELDNLVISGNAAIKKATE